MLNLARIGERMSKLNNWSLENNCIVKDFQFSNFKEGMDFVNKVAEIAEKQQHHPSIIIDFNSVHIMITTHEEKGLTDKDFDLALEIDTLSQ